MTNPPSSPPPTRSHSGSRRKPQLARAPTASPSSRLLRAPRVVSPKAARGACWARMNAAIRATMTRRSPQE